MLDLGKLRVGDTAYMPSGREIGAGGLDPVEVAVEILTVTPSHVVGRPAGGEPEIFEAAVVAGWSRPERMHGPNHAPRLALIDRCGGAIAFTGLALCFAGLVAISLVVWAIASGQLHHH